MKDLYSILNQVLVCSISFILGKCQILSNFEHLGVKSAFVKRYISNYHIIIFVFVFLCNSTEKYMHKVNFNNNIYAHPNRLMTEAVWYLKKILQTLSRILTEKKKTFKKINMLYNF